MKIQAAVGLSPLKTALYIFVYGAFTLLILNATLRCWHEQTENG